MQEYELDVLQTSFAIIVHIIMSTVHQVGFPCLESQLSSIPIPDLSGSADVVVGSIDYELTK